MASPGSLLEMQNLSVPRMQGHSRVPPEPMLRIIFSGTTLRNEIAILSEMKNRHAYILYNGRLSKISGLFFLVIRSAVHPVSTRALVHIDSIGHAKGEAMLMLFVV